MDLFFVLSGYLITSIILRQGGTPGFLRNFYLRAGLRTWPIYYLLIAMVVVLVPRASGPVELARSRLRCTSMTYGEGLSSPLGRFGKGVQPLPYRTPGRWPSRSSFT